jgi:lysophospholipase L1-like esterase
VLNRSPDPKTKREKMNSITKHLVFLLAMIPVVTPAFAADHQNPAWVGSWAASPLQMPLKNPIGNSTFRNVVHLTLGGTSIRITLTNQFGRTPLRIDNTHVALSLGHGGIDSSSDRQLTFNHHQTVSIPPGAYVVSDPIAMSVSASSDLAISLYLPEQQGVIPTCHQYGLSTNYIAAGDVAQASRLENVQTQTSWCFVQGVDVQSADPDTAAVVTLGDSITDGAHSTIDANHRYPDDLATRFRANKKTAHISVLNEGISGGRVLYEGHGPSMLQRIDRDVFALPGVRYCIYLEGINDIGQVMRPDSPEKTLTVDELILAATQLVIRAHQHGVKVMGATLLPFGPKDPPANVDWPGARRIIDQYNDWARTSHVFDGVVDFNKAVADPQAPQTMLPVYDSGDHVHPSDAGYDAMARAVDLSFFSR